MVVQGEMGDVFAPQTFLAITVNNGHAIMQEVAFIQ